MINRRLVQMMKKSMKYVYQNVICQWFMLFINIVMVLVMSRLVTDLLERQSLANVLLPSMVILAAGVAARYVLSRQVVRYGFLASVDVKETLRQKIFEKVYRLGLKYRAKVASSEIVQISVEGVEQLETYFGSYLPQFFYAMLAPLTLFVVIAFMDLKVALVLLICVPLIPVSIVAVQKFAKKLLSKYWGSYTELGDSFLENLQGLTTLKIYQSDEARHHQMNEEAEKFRKMTMRVLTMQLNSITVMDLVAYGGAALGLILACQSYQNGNISFFECLSIILLSADFFIPMRQLGSFFHVAMNGMAACDKIFRLLDMGETEKKTAVIDQDSLHIQANDLNFSYDGSRQVLAGVNLEIHPGQLLAVVGKSGCGKSTLAHLILGEYEVGKGMLQINDTDINDLNEVSLLANITYVGHQSYLFKGTVRDNLKMANPNASDEDLWAALKKVKIDVFLKTQQGLDTPVLEKGSNFSGGQCQRLALCRALLHDSPMYIFDEATSNIDVESEDAIMQVILELAKTKTVLLISHRLANIVQADQLIVMAEGHVVETGRHEDLMASQGTYYQLYTAQSDLENWKGADLYEAV